MEFRTGIFLVFCAAVASADLGDLKLEDDKPLQRVPLNHKATIRCCYRSTKKPHVTWIMNRHINKNTTKPSLIEETGDVKVSPEENGPVRCQLLELSSVKLSDAGLYQCKLNYTSVYIFTHGTFLQVYTPLQKTLNLSESVKNSIITVEGMFLLMCVLIPGTMLLCKAKRLNQLQKKKGREEENIYEGLNLDDCNSAYHQIRHSNQHGPYQDVATCAEDIQLEKP